MHYQDVEGDTISELREHGIIYMSDLWIRGKFRTKENIESMTKCKIDNSDYIKWNTFLYKQNQCNKKWKGKQKTGEKFLQQISLIDCFLHVAGNILTKDMTYPFDLWYGIFEYGT